MVSGILLLVTGAALALMVAACGRGHAIPGPSWFDIPQPTDRAANRQASARYQPPLAGSRGKTARVESRTASGRSTYQARAHRKR